MWSNCSFLSRRSNEPAYLLASYKGITFAMVLTMISDVENALTLITQLRYAHCCIKNLVAKFIQVSLSLFQTFQQTCFFHSFLAQDLQGCKQHRDKPVRVRPPRLRSYICWASYT